jgi:hypothetical protein
MERANEPRDQGKTLDVLTSMDHQDILTVALDSYSQHVQTAGASF